jgi:hypothetical protein
MEERFGLKRKREIRIREIQDKERSTRRLDIIITFETSETKRKSSLKTNNCIRIVYT